MHRVVKHLRAQGIKAWMDNERLVSGTQVWKNEIEKAIIGALAIVVVLSPDAKKSEWVLREITLADQYQKWAFPVLIYGKNEDSIPFRLITRQFVDIRSDETTGLNSLSSAILFYMEELSHLEEERQAAKREIDQLKQERELAEKALHEVEQKANKKPEEDRIAQAKLKQDRLTKEKTEAEQKAREKN